MLEAFTALMRILEEKNGPVAAGPLVAALVASGHSGIDARRGVQLALERGRVRLDRAMRVVRVG